MTVLRWLVPDWQPIVWGAVNAIAALVLLRLMGYEVVKRRKP